MTDRVRIFESEPVPRVFGLVGLTEPDPGDRVRAIIDIPLIGPPSSGKSQLAAALLRTLKARAPELPPAEADANRMVMRQVMGGRPQTGPRAEGAVPHYTFRVSIGALLDMLPTSARIGALLKTDRLALPIGTALLAAALTTTAAFFLSAPLTAAFATAAIAFVVFLFVRGVRVATFRAEADGDVELVFWDPPGSCYRPDLSADTYDFLAHLSRRRRQVQPAWRSYSFIPALVVNPIDYGSDERRGEVSRLRSLLPMFSALGGEHPQAFVAINRWTMVSEACPSGASKDDSITIAAIDRDGESSRYELSRMAVATDLVETEDGNDAGVVVRYLRYEAATSAHVEARNDALEYNALGGGGTLLGVSQTSLVRTILESALSRVAGYQPTTEREQASIVGDHFAPDEESARMTLQAMTGAIRTGQ